MIEIILLLLITVQISWTGAFESISEDKKCLNGALNESDECICNEGFVLQGESCFMPIMAIQAGECPLGRKFVNGQCITDNKCMPGYEMINGKCEIPNPVCPQNTHYENGFCHPGYSIMPPFHVDIPIPELIDPPQKTSPVNVTELNLVQNNNTVSSPNSVHTVNENNIFVYVNKGNEGVKIISVKNNETTVYDDTKKQEENRETEEKEEEEEEEEEEKCCTVVSPRICRKQGKEWVCFHRKHHRCGEFCTSDTIYLRTRSPIYKEPVLVMPPRNYPGLFRYGMCHEGVCPPTDCSGCVRGLFRCSPSCYTYDCQGERCDYIDQAKFCASYKGSGCDPINEVENS